MITASVMKELRSDFDPHIEQFFPDKQGLTLPVPMPDEVKKLS